MAPRKKNQTTAEQTAQEQEKNIQTEQATQEQTDSQEDQTTQEQTDGQEDQTTQEDQTSQEDQTGQEQTGQEQTDSQENKTGQEQERDEFADIPNPCVYCGPSVRGVARQYTTYQGGIPAELKEFIKVHPAARGLIIPTAKFASVRKRLETHGTAEAIIYKRVKDEL